jgi:hypothetical protein
VHLARADALHMIDAALDFPGARRALPSLTCPLAGIMPFRRPDNLPVDLGVFQHGVRALARCGAVTRQPRANKKRRGVDRTRAPFAEVQANRPSPTQ